MAKVRIIHSLHFYVLSKNFTDNTFTIRVLKYELSGQFKVKNCFSSENVDA